MKKFLAMALGLVLIGTTVMSLSDASRDAYHTHLYQQALKTRAARRFATGKRARTTRDAALKLNRVRTKSPSLYNLRYPRNKRNLFGGEQSNLDRRVRPMSKTIGFAANRTSREALKLKNLDPIHIVAQTVVTNDFSVELPRGWNPTVKNGVLRVGDKNTFSITVRRVEDICENVSFQSCAINLSNKLNHTENISTKINSGGKIVRLTQSTDRILGTNKYTNTHIESFVGTFFGRDVFISRYFIEEPGTENVFLIDTITDRKFASEAVVVAKRMQDSFRMIIQ
jgi:hypothetical protein